MAEITTPMIHDTGSSLIHIWQGIESLFDVRAELSFRKSILVAQLTKDIEESKTTYKRVRESYKCRSNAAHGSLKNITRQNWEEAWLIILMCMNACLKLNKLPTEEELIASLFS